MILPIKPISQRNAYWSRVSLGFSSLSLAEAGCAVVALTMLVNHTRPGEGSLSPQTVNAILREKNLFTGPLGAWIAWPNIPAAFPHLYFLDRVDAPNYPMPRPRVVQVTRSLDDGLPVIAYVDAQSQEPGLQQHFVLIVGYDDTGYQIADPWDGALSYLCPRYGPTIARALCGLIFYDHDTTFQTPRIGK